MEESLYSKIPQLNPRINFHYRDNEYIISFKDNKSHLKINSKLFNLIGYVDNKRTLTQIVNEYNNSLEDKINNEFAYELLFEKLGYYNIIENNIENFSPPKSPSYLKLNTIIINEKYTKIISKPFLFLFKNRQLKIITTLCLILLSISFITQYHEIINYLNQIPLENFTIYLILMIVSGFIHELGHSAATYSFGGSHSGIGIGFYLFTPVLYSDVSTAWQFDTNKRIIVNLAGIYFELIFGTILIFTALLFEIKPLLLIPTTILLKTLFNLNPFFRTDGYWILSDLIRTPNLRQTSNELLNKFIKNRKMQPIDGKNIFLIFYAFTSNIIIFIFLISILIINPNSLITFPNDISQYLIGITVMSILYIPNIVL